MSAVSGAFGSQIFCHLDSFTMLTPQSLAPATEHLNGDPSPDIKLTIVESLEIIGYARLQ